MADFEPVFADLVRVFTTSEGIGPIVPGGAVPGHRSFAAALSAGDRFYYSIETPSGPAEWEVGRGRLESDGSISRQPIESSSGGAPVALSPGIKTIALTVAAEWYGRDSGGGDKAPLAGAEFTGAVSAPALTLGQPLTVASGGTGSATAAAARSALGLAIGSDVQAHDARLAAIAGLATSADALPYFTSAAEAAVTSLTAFARTVLAASEASAARTVLGVGSMATQSAGNVAITGGSLAGVSLTLSSSLAVSNGGTGASSAAGARANLGVTASGSDTAYAFRGNNLSDLASPAAARANLGVSASGSDTAYAFRGNNLSDLASAAAARTNLGLGSASVKNTGTSGDAVPLLNAANTWSAMQMLTGHFRQSAAGGQARFEGQELVVATNATGPGIEIGAPSGKARILAVNRSPSAIIALEYHATSHNFVGGAIKGGLSAGVTGLDLATNDNYAALRVINNPLTSGVNADGLWIGYANGNSGLTRLYGGGSANATMVISATGADTTGEMRCDSLRIDAAPAASAATATHKLPVSLNGTTYYLLLSSA